RQAWLRRRTALGVTGKDGRVRGDDAVATARPDHRNGGDLHLAALAVFLQRPAKGLVGQDAREVVHAAVALGLPDDGDHLVRAELPASDACLEPGSILHGLELDLCDLYRQFSLLTRCPE